ncbi:site-specific recombinase XerD [Mucilaginibacter yixingensis]|uniref:Site-specific recombinase XerD n=1 Tax=Mucilaginibacter yixingensis TaxID=1295612 RepID=A0A2T5JAF5_9SPHI|nr:tyrosine-type recombinase/integrase [Mucilaginibacter yixingensis]PTQ97847.1 site-specific recombinase XerD [Mucilaginibacter yixingensis]
MPVFDIEPKIVASKSLKNRSYILYYLDGVRYRLYNGNAINVDIHPNRAGTIAERNRQLSKLLYEVYKAFDSCVTQTSSQPIVPKVKSAPVLKSVEQAFKEVEADKLLTPLSIMYHRQLQSLVYRFLTFLTKAERASDIGTLAQERVEAFLNQYKSTSTYYMSTRRLLGVFFSEFIRRKYTDTNLSKAAPRLKVKAALHKTYTKEQLTNILQYLKTANADLYLCCLLSYSCLLRPHREIRVLKLKHFSEDYSIVSLSGSENKSARVRVVGIPDYLQNIIRERLSTVVDPEANIFSLKRGGYNEYYFNLIWTRLRPIMIKRGLLQPEQTIYSFRHSAAVDVYNRTKDVHIVQQLMGHSTMVVTLKYLRGLGEMNSRQLKDLLPVLELA